MSALFEVLSAVRPSEIPQVVKGLDTAQLDVLVKYLYRGLASPDKFNSLVLLGWHEKAIEVAGVASIVRVLTSRQTV